ncbi:MAG: type II toxin-antitoxin system VapC family toxin [Thermoplasmata archaeon]|uniref:Type II toxin-antitoxin system VapC family toxin n=1 Tax=Candidatus Sysuiplasma superficiale TaxID=2823368 RepID=A0A8J7YYU4_9ARCH|nr:type II toxin-antitoxin system VapC family toxin [Candidatus Sysuiplasma superficiale]
MVVLDTNVVIDSLHGDSRVIDAIDTYSEGGKLSITVVNQYELLRGLIPEDEQGNERLREFLSSLIIHTLGEKEINCSAEIYQKLKERGKHVNELDIIIAGIAISNSERLLTSDKDFRSIKSSSPVWDRQIILLK